MKTNPNAYLPNQNSLPLTLALLVAISLALMLAAQLIHCKSSSVQSSARDSALDFDSSDRQIAEVEPRQFFKVTASHNHQVKKHLGRRATPNESAHDQTKEKQKITNATLKKLLSQTLLKSQNGTSMSHQKAPNFKFVFIQRATAAPTSVEAKKQVPSVSTQQPSLAASVSKQLASSLLNSAANLVGNLTSAPSLSSLASQMVLQTLDGQVTGENSIIGGESPVKGNSSNTSQIKDRISTINGEGDKTKTSAGKKVTRKPKPSKIYNLPVKFVSNGQPSHVVFNTIRQHFATIKKLQADTKTSNQHQIKRRKQQGGQKKKGNSRLIYLPLKYLSNGRPSSVIIRKASHKLVD